MTRYESPIGRMYYGTQNGRVTYIGFSESIPTNFFEDRDLEAAVQMQLSAYFSGKLRDFDLPVELSGTPFQMKVWQTLRDIPYGQTISYGELARRVGSSPRAVGGANHRNPVSIVVPCHRVIGADGILTGYGGGLERKAYLLQLEGAEFRPL